MIGPAHSILSYYAGIVLGSAALVCSADVVRIPVGSETVPPPPAVELIRSDGHSVEFEVRIVGFYAEPVERRLAVWQNIECYLYPNPTCPNCPMIAVISGDNSAP